MHRRRPLGVIGFRRRRSFRKLIDDERREGVEFLAILWHSTTWHCGNPALSHSDRYADDSLDLCDALGSYVPGAKVKLDEISKILGLSRKPEGIDGSRVEEMVNAG